MESSIIKKMFQIIYTSYTNMFNAPRTWNNKIKQIKIQFD